MEECGRQESQRTFNQGSGGLWRMFREKMQAEQTLPGEQTRPRERGHTVGWYHEGGWKRHTEPHLAGHDQGLAVWKEWGVHEWENLGVLDSLHTALKMEIVENMERTNSQTFTEKPAFLASSSKSQDLRTLGLHFRHQQAAQAESCCPGETKTCLPSPSPNQPASPLNAAFWHLWAFRFFKSVSTTWIPSVGAKRLVLLSKLCN